MAERYKSKRVIFPKGRQRKFLDVATEKFGGVEPLAKSVGLSARTIRDWRREKFSMDYRVLKKVCRVVKMSPPLDIETRSPYWYVLKGARAGGVARYKKYGSISGDSEYRKKKWREWWNKEGRYKTGWMQISKPSQFKKPVYSEELAEFVGIMLGDGGISKYQVTITLHHKDDKEYGEFVTSLLERLFEVSVSVRTRSRYSVTNFVISRIGLVRFCTEKLGLRVGNKVKQQVDIPGWVKRKEKYQIACTRGLVDTDGSIFTHRYKSKKKVYSYRKLSFTSRSKPLQNSVFNILNGLGIRSRISGYDVRLDSAESMKKYFNIVGSHNPKHLNRNKNLV